MPLNAKGKKIKANMEAEYGKKKGDKVFYASENAGTIKNVTGAEPAKKKKKKHTVKHKGKKYTFR